MTFAKHPVTGPQQLLTNCRFPSSPSCWTYSLALSPSSYHSSVMLLAFSHLAPTSSALSSHSCRGPSPCPGESRRPSSAMTGLHSYITSCLRYISTQRSAQPHSDPILNLSYSPPHQTTLPVSLFLLTTQPREELWKEMGVFVNKTKFEGGTGSGFSK